MNSVFLPPPVRPGSKVALIAPASYVDPNIVRGLIDAFSSHPDEFPGCELIVYPSALPEAPCGSFSESMERRMEDFVSAWSRDDVDMVVCARGGYGCVHLLDRIPKSLILSHPKWLVGFSDVSALHALLFNAGVASIHGGMAKQLVENTDSGFGPYRRLLKNLVESHRPRFSYTIAPHPYNIEGHGEGVLVGGNLAVLNGLAATKFDLMGECLLRDAILFIEDISEPIYAVERMLYRLYIQGVLGAVKGIVIGQFTEWRPDRNYSSMYDMIHHFFNHLGHNVKCPVVFDFPVGHNNRNVPLVEGMKVRLDVSSSSVLLESCVG